MTVIKKIIPALLLTIFVSSQIGALERAPELIAASAILYDYTTGRVLFEKEPDLVFPPASMTKLITLYLGWQNLEEGRFSRDELVEITSEGSTFSRPSGSSLMLLEEGQKVTYLEILKGLAISSGNDAAYALAHQISGSAQFFVDEMNELVQSLGYEHMYFEDPDGWSENNRVTAREYARFSADYIEAFPYALEEIHSQKYFEYPKYENLPEAGGRILTPRKKRNTNLLLGRVPGVDGLKTGYIDESGFNFTATAKRSNSRFIAVLMGIKDFSSYMEGIEIRAGETADLLEFGFRNYKTIYPSVPEFEELTIWEGAEDLLHVHLEGEPVFTLSVDEMTTFTSVLSLPDEVNAPILKGEIIGSLLYRTGEGDLQSFSVIASDSVEKANIFKVFWHKIVKQYNRLTTP